MSGTLRLKGSTSGYSELQAPAVAGDQTFILPATGGTLLTTASPAPTLTLESGTVTSPSLTFEGDSNTGIYSPAGDQLGITTGGSLRLIADNNGRVGIGTASPDAQLKVQNPDSDSITSAFAVRQNNAADTAQATCIIEQDPLNSSSRIIANGTTTPSLKLGTASTVAVTIDSSQQVGIGTTSPTRDLEIKTGTGIAGFKQSSSSLATTLEFLRGGAPTSTNNAIEVRTTSGLEASIDYAGGGYFGSHSEIEGVLTISPIEGSTEGGEIQLKNNDGTTTGATIDISSDDTCRVFSTRNNSILQLGQLGGTGGTIRFDTSASERMRINSSGGVGIGTTDIDGQLEVRSGSALGIISRSTSTQGTDTNKALRARNNSDTDTFYVSYRGRGYFAGDVGIGTSSPESLLEIYKNSANDNTDIRVKTFRPGIRFVDQSSSAADGEIVQDGGSMRFRVSEEVNASTALTERMRIDSNGNVGINTTSPSQKLEVGGSIAAGNFLGQAATTAMTMGLTGTDTAIIMYGTGFSADPNRMLFRTGTTNKAELDHVGRFVLGGITPGTSVHYSLCTSGRLQTTATYTNTTGSAANMHIASNGLVIRSTSSARYKTDVETLENSYADKLLECRPVWYRSTATDDTAHPEWGYYGFIAEEVAEVDPRLVHYDEQQDGTLQPEGVQYTQMIAHLVNIVKRQKQQLVDFEARLSALETAN